MPELVTPDGTPVDVTPPDADAINRQFTQVMNDDPGEQALPRREAPADAGEAEAPRRKRGGRTAKADRARTTDKPPAPVKADYTEDAQSSVGTLWTVAASIPYTQPYALVIDANSDALVSALAEGAKHNATIRRFVTSGGNTWMLQLASVGVTMGLQSYQLMRDPAMRAQAAEATRAKLKDALAAQGIQIPEPADDPAGA